MSGLTFGKAENTRPPYGQCWVCDEPGTVPTAERERIPAICGKECGTTWLRMLAYAPPSDRCGSSANLGELHDDALCQLPPAHEGDHVDGDFSWGWDEASRTGVISLDIAPKGLIA